MITDNKKLLIICPSMWPRVNTWGETQRMYYLANSLSQSGWKVYTLSPAYRSSGQSRPQYYKCFFLGNTARSPSPDHKANQREPGMLADIHDITVNFLIAFLNLLYNEPNCVEGIKKHLWMIKHKKEILDLISKNGISRILISVPSFSLMSLGPFIRRKLPGTVLIYDYRDPWFLWNRHKGIPYYKERKALSCADLVIGFSDVFSRDMAAEFGLPTDKIRTVYNGYSEADWKAFEQKSESVPSDRPSGLRLVFTGNISISNKKDNFRNLNLLIEAVKRFSEVELYLIGVNDSHAGTTEKNVHFIGNVSQEESFRYMKSGDVMLSIHDTKDCSGRYLISGKFYDYMRSGKVMWHIGSSDSLMSKWIRKFHLGVSCSNDQASIISVLQQLLNCWEENKLANLRTCRPDSIKKYSREYQNAKYEAFLESIH